MIVNNHMNESKRLLQADIVNDYYHWLCEQVGFDVTVKSYWHLAETIYNKTFYSFVPNDENRGLDGIRLRDMYAEETYYKMINRVVISNLYAALDGPCNMLEMLVGLAKRVDGIMADIGNENRTSKWFWEILENIELDKYTDEEFFKIKGLENVNRILDTVLERSYSINGMGGLFPLKNTKKNQRQIEIWYQMCDYLLENYNI